MKKLKRLSTFAFLLLFGSCIMLTSCETNSDNDIVNHETNKSYNRVNVSFKYEQETLNFIESYYNGNYKFNVEVEKIVENDTLLITEIITDNGNQAYLIKSMSENKSVFVEQNDMLKKILYFDLSMDSKEFTLDISEINDDESNQHTTYGKPGKWLGFNFKKFFGHSSRCGDKKYSLEPGSCYTNCVDTY